MTEFKKGIFYRIRWGSLLACAAVLFMAGCAGKGDGAEGAVSSSAPSEAVSSQESAPPPASSAAPFASAAPSAQSAAPEETVVLALDAYRALDTEKMKLYFVSDGNQTALSTLPEGGTKELLQQLTQSMSYTVGAAAVDGETAVVATEITNADLSDLFKDIMAYVLEESLKTPNLSQEELTDMVQKKVVELAGAAGENKVTRVVNVPLRLVDGAWKVELDDEMMDALAGGLLSGAGQSLGQLAEAFGQLSKIGAAQQLRPSRKKRMQATRDGLHFAYMEM